jgi:hypothetical protein
MVSSAAHFLRNKTVETSGSYPQHHDIMIATPKEIAAAPEFAEPNVTGVTASADRTLTIDALRWLERRYLGFELRALKSQAVTAEDAWWFTFAEAPFGPCRLDEIIDAVLDGASPAAAVHASRTSEDPVPWRAIHYRAWWSNPPIAKVWTLAFWIGWGVFGWFLVCLAMPTGAQTLGQLAYFLCVGGIVVKRRRLSARLAARFPAWARPIRPRNGPEIS